MLRVAKQNCIVDRQIPYWRRKLFKLQYSYFFFYIYVCFNLEPLRHKRSTTMWDLIDVYRHLASVSGGHVFQTTKDQIPNVFGILQVSNFIYYYIVFLTKYRVK
jgi:hypothetical protein